MHGPYDVARYETSGVPLTQALPTLKGLVEAKLHCSGLSRTQKLEGSAWGHVPQGNVFFLFHGMRGYFWAQTSLLIFALVLAW